MSHNQDKPTDSQTEQKGDTIGGKAPAGTPPPPPTNGSNGEPTDGWFKGVSSILNAATAFMSLAGKEWFTSLISQPTDPRFSHAAKFEGQFDRVVRLVVVVIILTAIVVGSVSIFADKSAALKVVSWAMWVLIIAFLAAIVYGIFAFLCGVRVCEGETRKKLTVAQILYSILYIFVPWIPIFAFLWVAAPSGGPTRLLVLLLLFYLCIAYTILNFARAISRISGCPSYRVWISVLLPIGLILTYWLTH